LSAARRVVLGALYGSSARAAHSRAADGVRECFRGVGQGIGGGDVDVERALGEGASEAAELVAARAYVDIGDRDVAFAWRWRAGDRGEAAAVGQCAQRVGLSAGRGVSPGYVDAG
jgi:hypothetical protein